MNEAQQRAWRALDIGPSWRLRSGADPEPAAPESTGPVPVEPGLQPGRPETIAKLDWTGLRESVVQCRACALCETRRSPVFGVGDLQADWMIVGEAPGAEEDRRGEPFVGKAGKLLDAMLRAVGRSRDSGAFIANVLKCRPPENRDPTPDEAAQCGPYLDRQIELLAPKLILVVGRIAARTLLRTDASIAQLRGTVHRYECGGRSLPLIVTYHPAYLLRKPADKAKSWADLQLALRTTATD